MLYHRAMDDDLKSKIVAPDRRETKELRSLRLSRKEGKDIVESVAETVCPQSSV